MLTKTLATFALATMIGRAGIVSLTGNVVQIAPPASVTSNAGLESDSVAFVFAERSGVTLLAPLTVDLAIPATFPPNIVADLPAGLTVNSYYLHADNVGSGQQQFTYAGEIVFSESILGLAFFPAKLNASAALLGAPGTSYVGVDDVEGGGTDVFTISADRHTLTFRLTAWTDADDIRIITSVPEPATGIVTLSVLAGLAFRRRFRA